MALAENGFDGLQRLGDRRVDAVLCDLTMPVMSGLEFARLVRRNPRFRRIPLVAVTGRQAHEDSLQTWEAGFDAHLVKPVTLEMLQSLARRLSSRRRQQRSGSYTRLARISRGRSTAHGSQTMLPSGSSHSIKTAPQDDDTCR